MSPQHSIREVLLRIVEKKVAELKRGPSLQSSAVLEEAARELGADSGRPDLQEAVLTEWGDLFRTGLLAWGLNINNPDPPFFHPTESGRRALATATRDPSNPAGYLRHLGTLAKLSSITDSYLKEGLECYASGLHKAAAVMVGTAVENMILELRDTVVQKAKSVGKQVPAKLNDWKIKTVTDALAEVFKAINAKQHRELRERFDSGWTVLAHQIRGLRNDAGHPKSIDPVTPDSVHVSLLVFPELAKLDMALREWVQTSLK